MTPKEKAEELFDRFFNLYPDQDAQFIAKQCALIAVDEIIESQPMEINEKFYLKPYTEEYYISTVDYWEQVKTEIENL